MARIKIFTLLFLAALLFQACSTAQVPDSYSSVGESPAIYPDYRDVTIPCNLAPVNFMLADSDVKQAVARITASDGSIYTYGKGKRIVIDESDWVKMLSASKGNSLTIEVFGKTEAGWLAYCPFKIFVASDEIDPYVSYRLIEPSYVAFEELSINQRRLTDFEESEIYNNQLISKANNGQCINCHSFQNYHTDNMLFHMRAYQGGTMMVIDGKTKKVDLKRNGMISAGVYPAWHPSLPLVSFSTNSTHQIFFAKGEDKVEVYDTKSDLVLYDVKKDEIIPVSNNEGEMETFPTWSPDGKWLYFCSTLYTEEQGKDIVHTFEEIKYNVYRMPFDADNNSFGPRELVYQADSLNKSATLPRISPDGRFMTFAQGPYGCFQIWHHEADIQVLDLSTGELLDTQAINSTRAESYPSWSSNSRWLMFASRRDDGNYSRIYIAYFDQDGEFHKAFELPQKNPEKYIQQLKSYNRPEFMVEPVKNNPQEFAK